MTDAERIRELEDALIDSLGGAVSHKFFETCPVPWDIWKRDPRCPACQRLERLIGHRRP